MRAIRFAASLTVIVALAGCSKVSVPNIPDISQIQGGAQQLRDAAQKCSDGSHTISEQTQVLIQAIRDKDTAAAQAAGTQLATAAAEVKQGAADGEKAAGAFNSTTGGQQAQAGITAAFKICGSVADYAQTLADKVATAKGDAAYQELSKAANQLSKQAGQAGKEAASQMSS